MREVESEVVPSMKTPATWARLLGTSTAIAIAIGGACADHAKLSQLAETARRSEWRQRLRWSPSCERAFSQTRTKERPGNGLRIVRLDNGWQLIEVRCAEGAYQPSQEFFGITPSGTTTAVLSVPIATFDTRGMVRWSTAEEVWGTVTLDAVRREATVVSVSRGVGDCGTSIVYRIDAESVITLEVATARGKACDDNSQAPTSWPVIR
jgi:hypothetical protein